MAAAHPDRLAASLTLINTGVLLEYRWHRMAKVWRTPLVGELPCNHSTRLRHARATAPRQPGPAHDVRVNRIAGHAAPRATKQVILRFYRSTRQEHIDALAEPLRKRDPDTLVVWVMPTFTCLSLWPISSIACSRAHGSKSSRCRPLGLARTTRTGSRTRRPIPAERVGELAEA